VLKQEAPGFKDMTRYDSWSASPIVDDKHVYLTMGSPQLAVLALDRQDGSIAWKGRGPGELEGRGIGGSALISHQGNRLLIVPTIHHVLGFEPATGTLLWSQRIHGEKDGKPSSGIGNTPVYADGMLHVSSGYGIAGKAFRLSDDGRAITLAWDDERSPVERRRIPDRRRTTSIPEPCRGASAGRKPLRLRRPRRMPGPAWYSAAGGRAGEVGDCKPGRVRADSSPCYRHR